MYTRMLFSCLVDADYLDTETAIQGGQPRGEGETLDTLAGMLNMDKRTFAEKSRQNFARIFPDGNVDAVYVTGKIFEVVKA